MALITSIMFPSRHLGHWGWFSWDVAGHNHCWQLVRLAFLFYPNLPSDGALTRGGQPSCSTSCLSAAGSTRLIYFFPLWISLDFQTLACFPSNFHMPSPAHSIFHQAFSFHHSRPTSLIKPICLAVQVEDLIKQQWLNGLRASSG